MLTYLVKISVTDTVNWKTPSWIWVEGGKVDIGPYEAILIVHWKKINYDMSTLSSFQERSHQMWTAKTSWSIISHEMSLTYSLGVQAPK